MVSGGSSPGHVPVDSTVDLGWALLPLCPMRFATILMSSGSWITLAPNFSLLP